MKNVNLIFISVLAAVLLSGTFISLAAAQDERVPDRAVPVLPQLDNNDNSTVAQGDEVIYTISDNRTAADGDLVPGEVPSTENPNLIAEQTSSDNTLAIVAVVAVLAIIVVGALIVVYNHKRNKKIRRLTSIPNFSLFYIFQTVSRFVLVVLYMGWLSADSSHIFLITIQYDKCLSWQPSEFLEVKLCLRKARNQNAEATKCALLSRSLKLPTRRSSSAL